MPRSKSSLIRSPKYFIYDKLTDKSICQSPIEYDNIEVWEVEEDKPKEEKKESSRKRKSTSTEKKTTITKVRKPEEPGKMQG